MTQKFKAGDMVQILHSSGSPLNLGKSYEVRNFIDESYSVYNEDKTDYWYFVEYLLIAAPKQHPHHDMIVAWAANPYRVVEYMQDHTWIETKNPTWSDKNRYRFADEVVHERVFPETSLSGKELAVIFSSMPEKCNADLLAVANAAIKQYILDKEEK